MKMRIMAWTMCLSILLQAVPVAAAENDTLNTWQLSNVKLEHTTVEFQVSGVESAQDASVVIEKIKYILRRKILLFARFHLVFLVAPRKLV